mmetsp:Transcript_12206/g.27944  ORF Transcript_12206/g.27944 Transcript_12206/m.27944 type:complete len:379 (-) Transcript_12206:182-1318(-)
MRHASLCLALWVAALARLSWAVHTTPEERSRPLHVMLSTDANQLTGLHGAMRSALQHSDPRRLAFHVICTRSIKELLELHMPSWLRSRSTLHVPQKELQDRVASQLKLSLAARKALESPFNLFPYYAPAFLQDMDVHRLLYLDTDTLAVGDVSELSHINMEGHAAAAVEDCNLRFGDFINFTAVARALKSREGGYLDYSNVTADMCSMNRGVFLMDIQTWARLNVTQEIEWWLRMKAQDPNLWHHGVSQPPWMLTLGALGYKKLQKGWNVRGCGWSQGAQVTWDQTQGMESTAAEAVRMTGINLARTRVHMLDDQTKVLHFNGRSKPWLDSTKCGTVVCSAVEGRFKLSAKAKCPTKQPMSGGPVFVECADIWRTEIL